MTTLPLSAKQLAARAADPSIVQTVPAPSRGGDQDAKWWPDLFLKKGRVLQAVTVPQLVAVSDRYRDEALNDGRGAADTPDIQIYGDDGKKIGFVSWNGRIWLHDVEGNVEVPQ